MGGGGDGGYGARQDADEARKAAARAKINELFGISAPKPAASPSASPSGPRPSLPSDPSQRFTGGWQTAQPAPVAPTSPGTVDPYGPAAPTEAERNKTGLEALYGKVRDNAFTSAKRALDEQRDDQQRSLKFELFARGLRGGSADIEQNARLGLADTEGLTRVGANADGLVSSLRANDEQTRLGLLQSIDAGMDEGSALSSALAQLKNNSERATAEAQGQIFGDMLGAGADAYAGSQRAKGQQRAQQWWQSQMPRPRTSAQPLITKD